MAEFRQQWINALRADIVDYLALIERYRVASEAPDDVDRESLLRAISDETRPICYRIVLRINPWPNANSESDKEFLTAITSVIDFEALQSQNSEFEDASPRLSTKRKNCSNASGRSPKASRAHYSSNY